MDVVIECSGETERCPIGLVWSECVFLHSVHSCYQWIVYLWFSAGLAVAFFASFDTAFTTTTTTPLGISSFHSSSSSFQLSKVQSLLHTMDYSTMVVQLSPVKNQFIPVSHTTAHHKHRPQYTNYLQIAPSGRREGGYDRHHDRGLTGAGWRSSPAARNRPTVDILA